MLDTHTPPHVVALRGAGPDAKPLLRGVAHRVAAIASPLAAALLYLHAASSLARAGAAVYGAVLMALFGVSGVYHLRRWSPRTREWLGRLDHANIFVFIAGTGVPLILLSVAGIRGVAIVAAIALLAIAGVAQTLFWPRAPRTLHVALYVIVGMPGLAGLREMLGSMGEVVVALQIAGGTLYVLGAITYGLRRPDPFPSVFGYHEVFHALVLMATACFYGAIWICVGRA